MGNTKNHEYFGTLGGELWKMQKKNSTNNSGFLVNILNISPPRIPCFLYFHILLPRVPKYIHVFGVFRAFSTFHDESPFCMQMGGCQSPPPPTSVCHSAAHARPLIFMSSNGGDVCPGSSSLFWKTIHVCRLFRDVVFGPQLKLSEHLLFAVICIGVRRSTRAAI